ncbi:MAG: hypothetical protein ACJ779_06750 [Chloroflexota bacterium]
MNLYTADLMVDERMRDRERDFQASQLAALARETPPGEQETGWRDRLGRVTVRVRVLRRRPAV